VEVVLDGAVIVELEEVVLLGADDVVVELVLVAVLVLVVNEVEVLLLVLVLEALADGQANFSMRSWRESVT